MDTQINFAHQVANKTDDELLSMLWSPADWIPEAHDAATEELRKRNVDDAPPPKPIITGKPFRPATDIAYITIVCLAITGILLLLFPLLANHISYFHLDPNSVLSIIINLSPFLMILITAIPFLIWIYQVRRNLQALGVTESVPSVVEAIGSYFIPLVNMIEPFSAMRDIWSGSMPANNRRSMLPVRLWWGTWLITAHFLLGFGLFCLWFGLVFPGSSSQIAELLMTLTFSITFAISACMAIIVVSTINKAQLEKHRDLSGQKKLVFATTNGHSSVIKALIASGADVNAKDDSGRTALVYTAYHGDFNNVQALIAAGADVNAKGNDGWSALMWAARAGKVDCVEALIAAGADINAADRYSRTAFHWAKHQGHDDCCAILRAAGGAE